MTAFPLSRAARELYALTAPSFAGFEAARDLAAKLNARRDLQMRPELAVRSGRLAAAALLDEVFAHLIAEYLERVERDALERAPAWLDENVGEIEMAAFFGAIQTDFAPPQALESRPATLEYALRLHLANCNPALANFCELFDAAPLQAVSYDETFEAMRAYFATLPPLGPRNESLFEVLMTPFREHPASVEAQLQWVLASLEELVAPFTARLLTHLDLIREEEKPTFFGPGPAPVLDFRSGNASVGMDEYEAFTPDKDWMPGVVLVAKQTYVWLDQLSKKYATRITRLDQVPDAELDEMASRGITGLWLIGLCQRSTASQKIKRITGNPDALASAYSLFSYDIAREIGGSDALENLKSRAGARGIRMASDMVPNHMAIDSQWIIERPDYFLSLSQQPFPNASFGGPDLCDNERIGIFLEDGYYSKTDASVVFKRVDYHSGETRFVYHGNDGTTIPWNDTAQLDYLNVEVREAVMQTILEVARQFPIIRFDAAMTLAKRHIHRLWFPAPGSGGDIPSRAGRGVSAEEFDALMPQEFWREVVERVGKEVPDTLLLAEAFWMMEGFFVRTLGMHRVYNSAFMNMLRDEKNAEYRQTLKNTLEFDPAILGRFVNFMNNPDEETAAQQFGKGDKYFGICTLLATLPGLPMIGHGQIEGYAEKYGMEYPRAYWNEVPDAGFIAHHERAIFPLLKRRDLFAGSDHFTLYDFWNGAGEVDEDVFAFSNRAGDERALVLFNNRDSGAAGWIKSSVGFAQKTASGDATLVQRDLSQALGLRNEEKKWTIFRENASNLEFLRSSPEMDAHGLFVDLPAYGHQVFLDFREVHDESGLYARLAKILGGAGVPDVERALKEMLLTPLHAPFRALCDPKLWAQLLDIVAPKPITDEVKDSEIGSPEISEVAASGGLAMDGNTDAAPQIEPLDELMERFAVWTRAASRFVNSEVDEAEIARQTQQKVEIALDGELSGSLENSERAKLLASALVSELGALGGSTGGENARMRGAQLLDEWLLGEILGSALLQFDAELSAVSMLKIWLRQLPQNAASPFAALSNLLADDDARQLLGINTFERVIYFRGEGWDTLKTGLELGAAFEDADFSLEILDVAAQGSEFGVVKWMELARATNPV